MKTVIRIGTRGNTLALYQAELVKAQILKDFSLLSVEIVKIKTSGDMIRRGKTLLFEAKRNYTREIEEALLRSEIDLAVHSANDLASHLPEGLKIGAVLEREDPRDCLVSKDKKKLAELPAGACIGASTLRRERQLLKRNPGFIVKELHGNVETRVRKIASGEYDAIVLSYAGLKRLSLLNYITEIFPEKSFYPAPGQGTIAVQSRVGDTGVGEILGAIHHLPSGQRLECERAFLMGLGGECQMPCGISTVIQGNRISATGALFATEGHESVEAEYEGASNRAAEVGQTLARLILDKGGRSILDQIRKWAVTKKPRAGGTG
ncbi:MAG: hydroxymethylbilane synthase [Candidatus Omnitrophica bacterium]|nr:hydroxymethylbilane synthase [Candidatus Omnitrophota bacterium]